MTIQNEQFGGPLKVPIPSSRETIPGQGASSRASRVALAERGDSSGEKRAVETRRRGREAQGGRERCVSAFALNGNAGRRRKRSGQAGGEPCGALAEKKEGGIVKRSRPFVMDGLIMREIR